MNRWVSFVLLLACAAWGADFDSTFRAGLTALNNNDLATAQSQLEAAAKLQPKNAQVWLALAQAYGKAGKTKPAGAAVALAEQLGADDPLVLHGLAYYYTEALNPAKGAMYEARYAQKNPRDEEAVFRAMDLYLRAGLPKAAIALARKTLAVKNEAALRFSLAKALEADNQFEQAIPEFKQVVTLRPYDEAAYFELAQAYLRRQKFAEALAVLQPARAKFDKSAQIELAAGVALYGLRRFPETIEAFLHVIQIDPEIEQPYVFLGRMIEVAEGKLPEVAGALGVYASSKPKNYISSYLYAKALAAQQAEPVQYEPLLRKSIELNGKFWESHFELGTALERSKDFPGAAAEFEKAIGLNPKDATTHYRLARVYDRLGQKDKAAAERALHAKLSATPGKAGMGGGLK